MYCTYNVHEQHGTMYILLILHFYEIWDVFWCEGAAECGASRLSIEKLMGKVLTSPARIRFLFLR